MSNERKSVPREAAEARRERLAIELRANLLKRKAQARARAAPEDPPQDWRDDPSTAAGEHNGDPRGE